MVNSTVYIVMRRLVLVAMFMNMHRNNSKEYQYVIAISESWVD